MCQLALAGPLVWLLSASLAHGAPLQLHLRAGRQPVVQPPNGVAPPASATGIQATFAKMDMNKDGKVDSNEFAVAVQSGLFPGGTAPAPAPAPTSMVVPIAPAYAPAAAPSAAKPTEEEEVLPPHRLIPPPLPQNIPEPPPPPRAPPAEPAPPPLPPREGQLVEAPPSEESLEASGNATEMMANVPGLDLDGKDPLQAPNTPAPLPKPMAPPDMPKIAKPMSGPDALPESLMVPSTVSFGLDMARSLPAKMAPLGVVSQPPVQRLAVPSSDPYRVLLSISSRRHTSA